MATTIYDTSHITLINGEVIEIGPLKIKYLRQFLDQFETVKEAKDDIEAMYRLAECAFIAMQQYYPSITTMDQLEDIIDLPTIYEIIDVAAGIKVNKEKAEAQEESIKDQATSSGSSWDKLDLAKLESDLFLLGIWKSYEELEKNVSMPELLATLEAKRDLDYQEKKFLAAMQGVDLDEQSGTKEVDPWEAMKARVASQLSGIGNGDPNDITALQGVAAAQAGFGIGDGLEYEKI